MATSVRAYLPVKVGDLKYSIVPEMHAVDMDFWSSEIYAQGKNLDHLPPSVLNGIAGQTKAEKVGSGFLRHARDNSDLSDKDVEDAYRQLRDPVWVDPKWIRSKGVVVWAYAGASHPRIISDRESQDRKSIFVGDYRVINDKGEYMLDVRNTVPDPIVSIEWPRQDGNITPSMVKLLGASNDTHVWSNSDPRYGEGLRPLVWRFWVLVRPDLGSDWGPLNWYPGVGSLLGRRS